MPSASPDVVFSGEYQIRNCGSQARKVVALLDKLWEALQPVIEDATSAQPGEAYFTFFKAFSNAPFVSQVLRNVSDGASISPWGAPPIYQNVHPLVYCVTGPGQLGFRESDTKTSDAYTKCVQKANVPIYQLQNSPFILICPGFFELPSLGDLPVDNTCLTVSTYIDRFQESGQKLTQYRIWLLLDMIVRFYITSKVLNLLAVGDVNSCVRLSSEQAAINPRSYTYYVACEIPSFLVLHIVGRS